MKTGIVDTGGGLRGIYATGVFDFLMDNGIDFNLCIGVSAGSANLCSYLSHQRGRNFKFYTEYAFRRQYMGALNFLTKRSYFDLDYVYSELSNSDGENPLDYNAMRDNPAELLVVACNAKTGATKYFDKGDIAQDSYDIMKASSAIPFVCKPYVIKGVPYYDGALGDTVPFEKAFDEGCDKVVLILTKPKDTLRTSSSDEKLAKMIRKKYPLAAKRLAERAERYNKAVARAKKYEEEGRLLIIAPNDTCGVDTIKKSKESLIKLYQKGFKDAEKIPSFLGLD